MQGKVQYSNYELNIAFTANRFAVETQAKRETAAVSVFDRHVISQAVYHVIRDDKLFAAVISEDPSAEPELLAIFSA